jgi:hypothetical protein
MLQDALLIGTPRILAMFNLDFNPDFNLDETGR